MKCIRIMGLCVVVVLMTVPATAQAFNTYWEVKGPPGPPGYHKLALSTPETLIGEAAALKIVGADEHKAFNSTCITNAEEVIENEAIPNEEGIDTMTTFVANCGPAGVPYPCSTGESYSIANVAPWPSELVLPTYDAVENVEVKVTCELGMTALYHPPGHLWNLKFAPNILVPLEVAGVFKNKHTGGNYFYFKGNTLPGGGITLKPAKYAGVR